MQSNGKRMIRAAIWAALLMALLCATAAAETLGPGAKGDVVRQLQQELKDKGYFAQTYRINSTYTALVTNAVCVFQIANNIKPAVAPGYADDATQQKIASADAVLYSQYIEKLTDAQCKLGGSGRYVKNVQTRLKFLGYYSGKLDGRYQQTTVDAVKFFETANAPLKVDGVADAETRSVLYNDPNVVTRVQYDALNYLTPLGAGATGTQVTQLQEKLAAKGFYWGDPSGVYDAQTRYCVRFFQEANGLAANGIASRSLRTLANDGSAVKFEDYTKNMQLLQLSSSAKPGVRIAVLQLRLRELEYYTGVITGVYSGSVITAVRTFQIFNNMSPSLTTGKANIQTRTLMNSASALKYSLVNGSNTLKSGMTGDAVAALQTRLKALGYYNGSIDGKYTSSVVLAVKLFQKLNGLYVTGIAYTTTQTVLNGPKAVSYVNANVERLIAIAESHLGDDYKVGARGPDQFDCSGFTYYCLKKMGIDVNAEVKTQGRTKYGRVITDPKLLRRGDILYFWSPDHVKKPGHAGIYRGRDSFIHASSTRDEVVVSDFTDYNTRSGAPWFLWAIRVWE